MKINLKNRRAELSGIVKSLLWIGLFIILLFAVFYLIKFFGAMG